MKTVFRSLLGFCTIIFVLGSVFGLSAQTPAESTPTTQSKSASQTDLKKLEKKLRREMKNELSNLQMETIQRIDDTAETFSTAIIHDKAETKTALETVQKKENEERNKLLAENNYHLRWSITSGFLCAIVLVILVWYRTRNIRKSEVIEKPIQDLSFSRVTIPREDSTELVVNTCNLIHAVSETSEVPLIIDPKEIKDLINHGKKYGVSDFRVRIHIDEGVLDYDCILKKDESPIFYDIKDDTRAHRISWKSRKTTGAKFLSKRSA